MQRLDGETPNQKAAWFLKALIFGRHFHHQKNGPFCGPFLFLKCAIERKCLFNPANSFSVFSYSENTIGSIKLGELMPRMAEIFSALSGPNEKRRQLT